MAGLIHGWRFGRLMVHVCVRSIALAVLASALAWSSAAHAQTAEPAREQAAQEADSRAPVTCLLPAEIDRFGTQLTIIGARQRIETSRADCAERGGEVVEERRAATQSAR